MSEFSSHMRQYAITIVTYCKLAGGQGDELAGGQGPGGQGVRKLAGGLQAHHCITPEY